MIDNSDYSGLWLTPPHEVRARKEHRCQNCRGTIPAGERYTYAVWLDQEYDSGIMTVKCCGRCVLAAEWLNVVCNGHLWGNDCIAEDLQEHWDEEWDFRCRSFALLLSFMGRGWKTKDGRPISPAKVKSLTTAATAHAVRVMQPR
jgi:hypothetical protein